MSDPRPAFHARVVLGGRGGTVPLLQRAGLRSKPLSVGIYACFPVDRVDSSMVELPVDLAKRLEPHLLALIFENGNGPKAEDVLAFTEALKRATP